jgi:hypothetical protein
MICRDREKMLQAAKWRSPDCLMIKDVRTNYSLAGIADVGIAVLSYKHFHLTSAKYRHACACHGKAMIFRKSGIQKAARPSGMTTFHATRSEEARWISAYHLTTGK